MNIFNLIPAIFGIGSGEIVVIVLVVLLLFGGKKIPELMRGIGKGVRSFKQGLNDVTDEIDKAGDSSSSGEADKSKNSRVEGRER